MKAVLSSEILRPKGGKELLESWGVEEWTLRAALEGSRVALLLLNWMALRIFTTSNCERFEDCLNLDVFLFSCPLSMSPLLPSTKVFIFIAATIFPLEEIHYTQRMNVAAIKVKTFEEDRYRRKNLKEREKHPSFTSSSNLQNAHNC